MCSHAGGVERAAPGPPAGPLDGGKGRDVAPADGAGLLLLGVVCVGVVRVAGRGQCAARGAAAAAGRKVAQRHRDGLQGVYENAVQR